MLQQLSWTWGLCIAEEGVAFSLEFALQHQFRA